MNITFTLSEVNDIIERHVLNVYDVAEAPLSTACCFTRIDESGELVFVVKTTGPYENTL